MTAPKTPAPAGWYPDPDGIPGQRYFDGTNWTEQRAPAFPVRRKSTIVGALLQLFLGGLGIGRFYIGSIGIGAAQLCLGLCFMIGVLPYAAFWIFGLWVLVDVFYIGRGNAKDSQGRPVK